MNLMKFATHRDLIKGKSKKRARPYFRNDRIKIYRSGVQCCGVTRGFSETRNRSNAGLAKEDTRREFREIF